MHALVHSLPGRALSVALASLVASLGCIVGKRLAPADGVPQFQETALIAVPGGVVNSAGGNLMIERLEISIDTVMGTWEIRSRYNSTSGRWLFSFQISYDGAIFIDPTGARHDVSGIPDGDPVPGTVWTRVDAQIMETRGGLGFHFDAQARLDHVSWRSGDHPRIQLGWAASSVEIAACTQAPACLPFLAIDLTEAGDPLRITDLRSGRVADFSYDALGRLRVARTPLEVAEDRPGSRYEYQPAGTRLTAITSSEGERIEYAWQTGRRIRRVTQIGEGDPRHVFRFLARDADGLYVTRHINPLGAESRYYLDDQRRVHRIVMEESGETVRYEWTGQRITRATMPDATSSAFTWVRDDVATWEQPSGNVIAVLYEEGAVNFDNPLASAVARIDDSLGPVEVRTYDALGRLEGVSNAEGETISRGYGVGGSLASVTAASGVTQTFPLYGIHGHWLQASGAYPDARLFDAVGNERAAATVLRPGGVLTYEYDANRNLSGMRVATTDAGAVVAEATVSIQRRSDGQLTHVARPGGGDHVFEYDLLGRPALRLERVDGEWHGTAFEYDLAGNVTARTLPNGMREEREYDGYSRLVRRRFLRNGVLEGESLLARSNGVLVALTDSVRGGTEIYLYDTAGRRRQVIFSYGESASYEYDLRSRRTRETLSIPQQGVIRVIDIEYDLADRETAIDVDGEEILRRTRENGQLTAVAYANGLTRTFLYDPLDGLLVGTATTNEAGEIVAESNLDRTLEVDPVRDQLRVVTDTPLASTEEQHWLGVGGATGVPSQLVGKRVFGWSDGHGEARSYVYDELSNRIDAPGESFAYNAERNRLAFALLEGGTVALDYTWDAAGFATSRGGVPIAWTAAGRLASIGDTEIEWDLSGRPISWTLAGATLDFSLFGGRVQRDPETGILIGTDLGEVQVSFGPTRRYRHADFRGNVSFVSDEDGDVVSHFRYSPYGIDVVFGEAGAVSFAGGTALGDLVVLGQRIYDPAVGRFLSPDPVFQLRNPYAYALGNPIWRSDPSGREGTPTGAEVGAAAFSASLATGALLTLAPGASVAAVLFATVGFAFGLGLVAFVLAQWANDQQRTDLTILQNPISELARLPDLTGPVAGFLAPAAPSLGCSPSRLADVPDAAPLLALLIPLQLILGWALARRRRVSMGVRVDP